MKRGAFLLVLFVSLASFTLSADILWRGVPWGSPQARAMKEMGASEVVEQKPGQILIYWGYTMTALSYDNGRLSDAFSLVDVQPDADWADVFKDLVEQYSGIYKMWPIRPTIDGLMKVLRDPNHGDMQWFISNIHDKFAVVWKDPKGAVMVMSAIYNYETSKVNIRILMSGGRK